MVQSRSEDRGVVLVGGCVREVEDRKKCCSGNTANAQVGIMLENSSCSGSSDR